MAGCIAAVAVKRRGTGRPGLVCLPLGGTLARDLFTYRGKLRDCL